MWKLPSDIRSGIESFELSNIGHPDVSLPGLPSLFSLFESHAEEDGRHRAWGVRRGDGCADEKWLTFLNSYTIVGVVVGGAGWYLYRLARGPEGENSYSLGRVCPFVLEVHATDDPFLRVWFHSRVDED